MARDRDYTKMDLTGIGGRDSRGTSCDLANITVPGAQPNNYALTSNTVSTAPGSLRAAATGPFGALNPTTNAGSLNRCDTNSFALALSQGRAEFLLRPVPPAASCPASNFRPSSCGPRAWIRRRNPELSATNIAIDTTNPYFQSINGETTQNVSFAFGPFMGSQSLTDYNNVQVFHDHAQADGGPAVRRLAGEPRCSTMAAATPPASTDRSIRDCWLNRCAGRPSPAFCRPALVASQSLAGNAVDPYNLLAGNPAGHRRNSEYRLLRQGHPASDPVRRVGERLAVRSARRRGQGVDRRPVGI